MWGRWGGGKSWPHNHRGAQSDDRPLLGLLASPPSTTCCVFFKEILSYEALIPNVLWKEGGLSFPAVSCKCLEVEFPFQTLAKLHRSEIIPRSGSFQNLPEVCKFAESSQEPESLSHCPLWRPWT